RGARLRLVSGGTGGYLRENALGRSRLPKIATLADKEAVEAEMPWQERWRARTLYGQLAETAGRFPERKAVTFQLRSGPRDKALTLTWAEMQAEVTQAANLFRRL